MFWLKYCPRCRGDLFENVDIHGDYIACLQCGHYLSLAEEDALRFFSPEELSMAYRTVFANQPGNASGNGVKVDRDAALVS